VASMARQPSTSTNRRMPGIQTSEVFLFHDHKLQRGATPLPWDRECETIPRSVAS
jgi:hypothetical protein